MMDDLLNYQDVSEGERTEILFMMTDLNDEKGISLDDLRKILSGNPQRAKQYSQALMKGSRNVRSRIETFVSQVK